MLPTRSLRFLTLLAATCALPLAAATHTPRLVGETSSPLPYMEYLPDAYLDHPEQERPLLIFLHGDGESGAGTDGAQMYAQMIHHGPHKEIAQGSEFFNQQGMLVLSPQVTRTPFEVSRIKGFLDWVRSEFAIDSDRIYLTGLSNGAIATWYYARTYPQDMAALLPIAGGDTVADPYRLVGLPIWAFHNFDDTRFSIATSTNWLDGIASAATGQPSDVMASYPAVGGGPATMTMTAKLVDGEQWIWQTGRQAPSTDDSPGFTVYPQTGHDAWSETYDTTAVWQWLADQRRPSRTRQITVSIFRQGVASTVLATAYQHGSQVAQESGTAARILAPSSLTETRIIAEEGMPPIAQ